MTSKDQIGRDPSIGGGGKGRLWPIIITVGLTVVVVVNALFIYLAVKGADDIVPSYNTEER